MAIWDDDRKGRWGGGGGGGGGEWGERVKARPRTPTRKAEEAVDRRQNNRSVKAGLCVYLTPQNIPRAIELTLDNKVLLYCIGSFPSPLRHSEGNVGENF